MTEPSNYNMIGSEKTAEEENVTESSEKEDEVNDKVTFRTYGIEPETIGVYGEDSRFSSINILPFAIHETYPQMDVSHVTEMRFIMTGQKIDQFHEKFPEINVVIPGGVFYEDELVQAIIVVNSDDKNEVSNEKILEELKGQFPNIPLIVSFTELITETPDKHILNSYSFGYGLNDYSYIQDLSDANYAGNIETILELTKNNTQFVDESVSIGENDMSDRAYKSMYFYGFFKDGNKNEGYFGPHDKDDTLRAGVLGIWSEIPLKLVDQEGSD